MTGPALPRDGALRAASTSSASMAATGRAALLTALAYAAAGRLGLMLTIPPGCASLVWPAAGIALAAVLRLGRAGVIGVAIGAFALGFMAHIGVANAAACALDSALQAGLGAWLLRRFAAYPFATATPLSLARFCALGGLLPCGLAACPGFLGFFSPAQAPAADALSNAAAAWGGGVAGVVVFAPALLAFDAATLGASLRRAAAVLAAALCATAATVALVWIDVASVQRGVQADFALQSHELASRIEATVNLGQHAVEGLAGDFASSHERDLGDFKALADKLAAFGLGIQALEWIPRVAEAERGDYESRMAQQWRAPFRVFERRDGKPVEVASRPAYFPVGFVAPYRGNEGAVGFDLASNPARNAALIQAQDNGQSIATAGVKLVQNNAMGILLFTPVYVPGAPAATLAERRAALKGFALGVFSVPDLLRVAFQASDTSMLDYWLIDETDAGAPTVLASDSEAKPDDYQFPASRLYALPRAFGQRIPIRVADRVWSLRLAPTAAYVSKHSDSSPYWLLIGGVTLTALVIGFVLVSVARQHQLVDRRERDLENQKFALDQHAIVSIADARGTISYANDRFCEISRYERERLIGANHNIVASGRHDRAFYQQLWSTLRARSVWRGEICNRDAEGGLYWLDATIVPLTDRQGDIDEYIAICTDITARKRLEQELESSRSFLQSVTDSIGEGVYTIDEKGRCTFLNAEAERLIGWTFEDMRGQRLHDLVHYQDAAGAPIPACDCRIMEALQTGRKCRSEDEVFTHRDGRVFPVSVVAVRLEREGRPAGAVVVFQDITERRRVQQELVESEQRLSIALSASSTGLWDYNPIADKGVYGDAWFRMLGYEPRAGALGGGTFFALLHPEDFALYREAMARHADGVTAVLDIEFRMRRADGEWAWIRSIGKIVERDPAGRPSRLIGVHIDNTAARQIQTELADAKDVAVRASQAKSEFLATMSHEIRTPMNAIIGLSHLFARTQMNARQRDYLTKIQNAAQALLGIINDILDFSKIEAGRLTIESVDFELDEVLEGAVTVIAPKAAEKGLSLVVERSAALPNDFVGDPLRLSQLLINLLGNAAKFTARGEVRVTLGGEPQADGQFRLEASVADSGIGMSQAQMAMLFRPFTQADASTSRRFGGTGLGLAICRQIVNLMGGDISVRSLEGVGTTFTFWAPLRTRTPAVRAQQEFPATEGGRQAPDLLPPDVRILVVEDNPINQQVATELLATFGVEATVAESGERALEILAAETFDLILMDMQMPGMDGLATTAAIRNEIGDAHTPIVAMTANVMAGDRERCLEAGMNDHVGKPIDPGQLARTLARWLEGRARNGAHPRKEAPAVSGIAGVDVEFALRNLGGNAELLAQLLDVLVEEHRDQARTIARAAAIGDWKRVRSLAHGLKGAASTLGAARVAEAAREIEQAAREAAPDTRAIDLQCEALGHAIAEVVAGVAASRREEAPPTAADLIPAIEVFAGLP